MSARVMIVDDHQLLAESLAAALTAEGLEVARPTSFEPDKVLREIETSSPDVVLLDLWLADERSSVPFIGPIRERGAIVLVLTGETDKVVQAECIEAGAAAVVSKAEPFERLVEAVLDAASGGTILDAGQRDELLRELRSHRAEVATTMAPFEQLTEREQQVLVGLMEGRSAEQLAAEAFVSMATVRTHIRSILTKLGVHSQLAAVAMARAAGWKR